MTLKCRHVGLVILVFDKSVCLAHTNNEYHVIMYFHNFAVFFFSIVNSGAYRIINGTCAHDDALSATMSEQGRCPALRNIKIPCLFNTGPSHSYTFFSLSIIMCLYLMILTLSKCTC